MVDPKLRLIARSPVLSIQFLTFNHGRFALVGMDGMESYRLGPFDRGTTVPEMLTAVAADMRLNNQFGSAFDEDGGIL